MFAGKMRGPRNRTLTAGIKFLFKVVYIRRGWLHSDTQKPAPVVQTSSVDSMAVSPPLSETRPWAASLAKQDDASEAEKIDAAALQPSVGTAAQLKRIKRRVDLRVTVVLAVMYIANQLDRGNVSFA